MSKLINPGPVNSLVTPFTENGDIDFCSLKRYLDLLLRNNCKTIYSMPFNGKYEVMSVEEIMLLNVFVITYVKSKSPDTIVICGDPIYCPVETTIKFANIYESLGADVLSVYFGERYYSDNQMISFFNYLTKNTNIHLLVHEMKLPNGAGGEDIYWPTSVIKQLSLNDSIVAIKEDSKNDSYLFSLGKYIKNLHFIVSGGGMKRWRSIQKNGSYQSWLNGIGVVFPELENSYFDSYMQNNLSMCTQIESIESRFFALLSNVYWHQLTKCALEWRGLMNRHERLPMNKCTEDQYQFVANELDNIQRQIESLGIDLF